MLAGGLCFYNRSQAMLNYRWSGHRHNWQPRVEIGETNRSKRRCQARNLFSTSLIEYIV